MVSCTVYVHVYVCGEIFLHMSTPLYIFTHDISVKVCVSWTLRVTTPLGFRVLDETSSSTSYANGGRLDPSREVGRTVTSSGILVDHRRTRPRLGRFEVWSWRLRKEDYWGQCSQGLTSSVRLCFLLYFLFRVWDIGQPRWGRLRLRSVSLKEEEKRVGDVSHFVSGRTGRR